MKDTGVADSGIREPKNCAVLDKVKEYLSGGGTTIFACVQRIHPATRL